MYLSFVIPNVVNMNVPRNSFFTTDFGGRAWKTTYFVVLFLGTIVKTANSFKLCFFFIVFCLMNREKVGMLVVLSLYVSGIREAWHGML